MKILIYTDNHFCQYSSIVRTRGEHFSTRLENQIKAINWAESIANDCDAVVHLGDFFDQPTLNAEELSALKEITWSTKPHYFLVGNHEMGTADLRYNSTNILSKVGKIIDKPLLLTDQYSEMYFLPYILEENRQPLLTYLKDTWKGDWTDNQVRNTIIFSHNDISGLQYGQYVSKVGFPVEEIEKTCDLFINGHLHNQTQVSEKILNLGNLTGQDFKEDALKYSHCVAILDTDTLKVDLIVNPFALNFCKLTVNSVEDFDKQLTLIKKLEQLVLSIKCPDNISDEIKNKLKELPNVVTYRLTILPTIATQQCLTQSQLTTLNHIDEFKKFVLQTLDNTEILIEELGKL